MRGVLLVVACILASACAANTVNITGDVQPPATCLSRLDTTTRNADAVLSSATALLPTTVQVDVVNSIGAAAFTAYACSRPPPLQNPIVSWQNVVPADWSVVPPAHLDEYSSNSTWIQPWYYPPSSTGRFLPDLSLSQASAMTLYDAAVNACLLSCAAVSPRSLTFILFLAYGSCSCSSTLPVALNVSTSCCMPLVNETASTIASFPTNPSTCDAGALYGQLIRVTLGCPLNATSCTTGSLSTSCTLADGCCAAAGAGSGGDSGVASAEGTAAKWLVGLLLVAVACQLSYWVIKLRMCGRRGDAARDGNPVEVVGDAAILRHHVRRRQVARIGGHDIVIDNEEGEEMGDGGDMLAQLNEIARRMRLAFIRQQQQRSEPRRTKDEAQDAALEALTLFPPCLLQDLDPEECCCMCLDALPERECVRVLCGHVIHRECMREFLAHKLVSYRAPVTCPMCRATVLIQNSAPVDAESSDTNAILDDFRVHRDELPATNQRGGSETQNDTPLLAAQGEEGFPRQRRRGHSRGRRFRVAMANLAVENLLERRHEGESDRSASFESTPAVQPQEGPAQTPEVPMMELRTAGSTLAPFSLQDL